MRWKESKLRVVVWITVAMLAEAVFVLWPLGFTLECMGFLHMSVTEFVGIGFIGGLVIGLIVGLISGLISGLIGGFVVSLVGDLFGILSDNALTILFGPLVCSLVVFLCRELSKGGIKSVRQFFTPWRSERLYFGLSVGFFVMLYVLCVLLFSLWFYTSYLNANKVLPPKNPYFDTRKV